MKDKNKTRIDLELNAERVAAILSALPLIPLYPTDSPLQAAINVSMCESAANKLSERIPALNANEFRVVALAVQLAILYLSGQDCGDLDVSQIDSEWKKKLSGHFFALNYLNSILSPALDQLDT